MLPKLHRLLEPLDPSLVLSNNGCARDPIPFRFVRRTPIEETRLKEGA